MSKKLFTLLLAIVASIGTLFAQSGTCGVNLTWNLTDSVLTISGSGAMTDYSDYDNKSPWYSYRSSIATVIIGDEVTSIGDGAFYNCSGLTSVTIGNGVTSIGFDAFCACSGLTSITIPESVTSIGYMTFYNCSGLTSITIPNSVTSIGDYAFYKCSSLTSITIPESVTSIGDYAFQNCSGLTSITIPNSVTSIGKDAFSNCSGMTSVTLNSNAIVSKTYTSSSNISNIFGSQVTEYIIGESVTSIGNYAFYNCSRLISVTIPNSVTSIGYHAFNDCSGLTSITIPNSVTSIGEFAFTGCSGLESVTIGNSITSIGEYAFNACRRLRRVNISDLSAWCKIKFSGYDSNPLYYAHYLYLNGTEITKSNLVIPNDVTSIGSWAFSYCGDLTSVTIPASVTSIGDDAFYNCRWLTSVALNSNAIVGKTYSYSSSLRNIFGSQVTKYIIGDSVSSIGYYAFGDCYKLTSVIVPNSVTSIDGSAFSGCIGLNSVVVESENPVYDSRNNCNAIIETSSNTLIVGCKNTIFPNSVTSIGEYAFSGCSSLTSITIPNSVTSIGRSAFSGCSGLTSITIGSSVTSIGNSAFYGCSKLININMEAITPPSIEYHTFYESKAIVSVPFGGLCKYKNAQYWNDMTISCPAINQTYVVSATMCSFKFNVENVELQSVGIEGGAQQAGNTLEYIGLEPNSEYTDVPIVLTANTGEMETVNVSFTTTALELTTKQPKIVSSTTAILLAETNMSDAEINCGFEYKRNDAPADMAGTKVYAPVANGTMAGRLKNLNDQVYYKYRAFYESAAGNMYYGDWQYIFTGDNAIEFDPILYTYAATAVSETRATLKGYALAGSDDFTEQGFEYWADSRTANANAPRRMPAALGEHHFVQANGISMRVTLTDLDAGTVYKYRTYAKMGEQVIYGTEMSFTTTGEYKAPTYTIRFVDYDNTELLVLEEVEEGTVPTYTGEEPTREEDEQYTYTFSGWTPAIVAATEDATYTATYTATPKTATDLEELTESNISTPEQAQKVLIDGMLYIIRDGKTYNAQGAKVK